VIPTREKLSPYIPQECSVALKYRLIDTRAANTTPSAYVIGLFSPLGRRPLFMNSYFRIWRNARIVATSVKVELVNEGNEPVLGSIATMPWSEFTNDVSPILIANRPRSTTRL